MRLVCVFYFVFSFRFSDNVLKLNQYGKIQLRTLVVTERSIYKYDPKNYKVRKDPVPLSDVASIR